MVLRFTRNRVAPVSSKNSSLTRFPASILHRQSSFPGGRSPTCSAVYLGHVYLRAVGTGVTLDELHASVKGQTSHLWERYLTCSFKLSLDCFQGSRSAESKVAIINSFAYLGFAGPIKMRSPEEEFTIFEEWPFNSVPLGLTDPNRYLFGRYLGMGARDLPKKLDLKKRRYISTTSMDAELALVTANLSLAAPGKLMYDPFVGTGSFPVACAQFGALTFGERH